MKLYPKPKDLLRYASLHRLPLLKRGGRRSPALEDRKEWDPWPPQIDGSPEIHGVLRKLVVVLLAVIAIFAAIVVIALLAS